MIPDRAVRRPAVCALAVVLGAALALAAPGAATADPSPVAPLSPGPVPFGDDLHVIDLDGSAAAAAPADGPAPPAGAAEGFELLNPHIGINDRYTVRLVTNHGAWPTLDGPARDAVSQLAALTTANITLGSPTSSPVPAGSGEITIELSSASPCAGNPNWSGCAQTAVFFGRYAWGRVTINPSIAGTHLLYNVVAHELGHVLGLAHFDGLYQGQRQLMYSWAQDGVNHYRAGDKNGLYQLVRLGFGNGSHPVDLPAKPGRPSVSARVGGLVASWSPPTSLKPLTGYQVELSPGSTVSKSSSSTSHVFNGLSTTTSYRVRVRAQNQNGWSPWSDWSAPVTPLVACTPGIVDVGANHPFCPDVAWMVRNGVSVGYPDGTFRPGERLTRGAMAAFLYRLAGSPPVAKLNWFSDVKSSHPFRTEIAWMAEAGLSNGFPDGTFRPDGSLRRSEMAAFLYRLAGSPPVAKLNWFSDVKSSHPFRTEIAWMAESGTSTGYTDGTYRPAGLLSRGEMSAFLHRLST